MLTLQGKYNTANVYTDVVDEVSISQIIQLCNQEFTQGSRICMMPDVHAGSGCTVGTTMTILDKVVPTLVGVDIGCGMETVQLKEQHIELQQLDKLIYEKIPSGFSIRTKVHSYMDCVELSDLFCYKKIDSLRGEKSMGTLGGGNHFIELDVDQEGSYYLVVHSGSRHLGLEVANYYQDQAYHQCNGSDQQAQEELVCMLKAAGRHNEINKALKTLKNTKKTAIPKPLCYLTGELFHQYIHDMKIVQSYALWNRKAMIQEILKGMKWHQEECFSTIHNYIDTENMILRKGAVSAQMGERILIPINMRDGSLICTGKGNEVWNYSAPHGAGRLMSRGEAKQSFTLSEFKKEMKDVYSTSVGKDTLDECPMAYKSMDDIVNNIQDTVTINKIIRPVYNFKAGGE